MAAANPIDTKASKWAAVSELRRLWLNREGGALAHLRVSVAFDAVADGVMDAISTENEDALLAGYQTLQELHFAVTTSIENPAAVPFETQPAFNVGRLAVVLQLVSDAIRRLSPGHIEAELDEVVHERFSMLILGALHRSGTAPVRSSELTKELKRDKAAVSRKLDELAVRRLVATHRVGKVRLSTLTTLGSEVVRRHLAAASRAGSLETRVAAFRPFRAVTAAGAKGRAS